VQILAGQGMPRVDHFAHIGGALFGFLAVRKNFIWVDWGGRVELALKRRRERALADDEQELDELLARVGREGIQSLSPRERDFLKRMSERKSKGGR
jgi:hypothetical protein